MERTHNVPVGSTETLDGQISVRCLVLADGSVDTVRVHQCGDTITLAPTNKVKELVSLLQKACDEETVSGLVSPEPLRRFPALYERVRVHDAKNDSTWPGYRHVIEVGTGAAHSGGRAYVRLDGDEADSTNVFFWDEGFRDFRFRGNPLRLIPVDASEEN